MIRKLKLLGQKLLVDTCRAEADRFLVQAQQGIKQKEIYVGITINVSETLRYAKIYDTIARELKKDVSNLDRMRKSYIYEIWDVCVDEGLILRHAAELDWPNLSLSE